MGVFSKPVAMLMALLQALFAVAGVPTERHIRNDGKPVNLYVNGLLGYGEKSGLHYVLPSMGMTGNIAHMLEDEGYEFYVSSVEPFASNWDRACSLYAEITGTRVDYGEAHAQRCGHPRYGREYKKPLIEDWGPDRPLNLWGYSMGGQTVQLFASLLAQGSAQERAVTPADALSPLFAGGGEGLVHSVTTLNGSLNGSTIEVAGLNNLSYKEWFILPVFAFMMFWGSIGPLNGLFDVGLGHFGLSGTGGASLLHIPEVRNLDAYFSSNDNAFYDLSPAGAQEVNFMSETLEDVYYFSYASCIAQQDGAGAWSVPIGQLLNNPVDYLFGGRISAGAGYYYGQTFQSPGGEFTIDESWLPNDGQVNLVSAQYPFGAPHRQFDARNIERGAWQVMPTLEGRSHLYFAGLNTKYDTAHLFATYLAHMKILDETY